MDNLVPTKVFLTKGVGRHKYKLKSFEQALQTAGVAQQNLVQVSSILPPKCKIISRENGLKKLTPGQICYCVMARADTSEHGRLVASSVGVAIPIEEQRTTIEEQQATIEELHKIIELQQGVVEEQQENVEPPKQP